MERKKIAILGGGLGSLSTAYYITQESDWDKKYDITIYQMGWRLGGKGASGRNLENANRIEEHGLHIWFGFYDNAFRMMQEAYSDLGRNLGEPLSKWNEAFKPSNFFNLMEFVDNEWKYWPIDVPTNNEIPGITDGKLSDVIQSILPFIQDHLLLLENTSNHDLKLSKKLIKIIEKFSLKPNNSHPILSIIEKGLEDLTHKAVEEFLHISLDIIKSITAKDDFQRRLILILELGIVNLIGILKFDLISKPFESIDDYDYREWLELNGASKEVSNSAIVQAIYGLVFGGRNQFSFAAGTALKGFLRFAFTYKGSIAYRMQAGMGDTIMTPLYLLLKKKGVQFKFFHRIRDIHFSKSNNKITLDSIEIGIQAKLNVSEYNPLIDVKRLSSWPSEPIYSQLKQGEKIKNLGVDLEDYWTTWEDEDSIQLANGRDFDQVVMGISIGAFPFITKELIDLSPKWKSMVEEVIPIVTDAFQLWLYPDVAGLGWQFWNKEPVINGSFEEPFDTWADMTELLNKESWSDDTFPGNISYFCGPSPDNSPMPDLSDHNYPKRELEKVIERVEKFINQGLLKLWPNAERDGSFNFDLLVTQDKNSKDKLLNQFIRTNIQPSERYVMSLKGATKFRLQEKEEDYENFYLTGDWIKNKVLNAGCVESTVVSGIQTANLFREQKVNILWES
jgi:uncharacterized protein with NAD-binding domain and iron-sulfur cluster